MADSIGRPKRCDKESGIQLENNSQSKLVSYESETLNIKDPLFRHRQWISKHICISSVQSKFLLIWFYAFQSLFFHVKKSVGPTYPCFGYSQAILDKCSEVPTAQQLSPFCFSKLQQDCLRWLHISPIHYHPRNYNNISLRTINILL